MKIKIFTSFYNNFNNIPDNLLCIGIDNKIPESMKTTAIRNFLYTPNSILAPAQKLVYEKESGLISDKEFAEKYFIQVQNSILLMHYRNFNSYFSEMFSSFQDWFDSDKNSFIGIVFLSEEKPDVFSHRQLLSFLLVKNGFSVSELPIKPAAKKENSQTALF